jgi:hypothetical protein
MPEVEPEFAESVFSANRSVASIMPSDYRPDDIVLGIFPSSAYEFGDEGPVDRENYDAFKKCLDSQKNVKWFYAGVAWKGIETHNCFIIVVRRKEN